MTHWYLALKRFLRPGTAAMLLAIFLTVSLGSAAGHQTKLRPCGVVCEDASPEAAHVQALLEQKGFAVFPDREAMTEEISLGRLDCGAVLLPGIGEAVSQGQYAGFVRLLCAPDSFMMEGYEAHITAALYSAAAPAMTVQSAAQAGVQLDVDAVQAELDAMIREGYVFTFEVVTVEGTPPQAPDLGFAIARAAASLLLFAAIVPGVGRITADGAKLRRRIGRRAARRCILLPGLFWQTALYYLAAATALPSLALPLAGYVLLLTALGVLLARLPVKLHVLLPLVLLGSLALQPIYYDLTALYPQLAAAHWLLPPCWLLLLG